MGLTKLVGTSPMEPARLLIDRIIYVASLATSPHDIDTSLDVVRAITSRIDTSQPLSPSDREQLLAAGKQIEDYLVTSEPLREFTPESLQLQIEQHMQGNVGAKSRKQLTLVIVVATVIAVGAGLLPLSSLGQHIQAGGATEFSLLTVGAAWLFWSALPAFKSELRRAFLLISTAVTLLGLSMLEQPILEIFNLRHYPVVSLLFGLPILVASTLFHVGDVTYVRLLGIRNWWTTIWPVLIGGFSLSVITWFMPHPPTSEPELIHNIVAVMWAWILIMPVVSSVILTPAIRKVPELYKLPIRLLRQSMVPIIAVITYQYILRIVVGPYMTGFVAYGLFSLVIFMGLALLRAGYGFNKVSRY